MKKILLVLLMVTLAGATYAQNGGGRNRGGATGSTTRASQAVPPPVPLREISGIVKDTLDNTLIGATVTLTSKTDTIRAATNINGIFVLKNVKSATFVLTVTEMGFVPTVRKYLQNDAVKRLILDPIVLKSETKLMNEVKINGTPSIVYKVDTVEYKASDYKVRENATVDELLKKMEGFEVGTDGSVTHQGQAITKARLNGKDYAGGDVAQAIQNLPAEIVEKIQVVDDYGDQAARTGIKDGDPQKVLNITTRADRSIGTTGRLTGQYGNDDRYNAGLTITRLNANQQIAVIGNLRNTVTGVASSGVQGGATNGGGGGPANGGGGGGGSGSAGTTQSGRPSFSYRDQWSKKVQVNSSYSYNFNNNNSVNASNGQRFSSLGTTDFTNQGTRDNNSRGHNANFQLDYSIDSANFLQITPTFGYSNTTSTTTSSQANINYYDTGLQHNVSSGLNGSLSSAPNYSAIVFYQHIFKKPRRNTSIQLSINRSNNQANSERNNEVLYYGDATTVHLIGDSVHHYQTFRNSLNTTYRTSLTYVEPLGILSQIEFNGQVRKSVYDNSAITDTVMANNVLAELPRRNNISNYSFTEGRATFNYRFSGSKYNFSLGTTLVPSVLQGTKVNSANGESIPTERSNFRIIPVFRFGYAWSRTERFTLSYSGSNSEPSFQEIQPFTDITNSSNPIVGNPDLKPSFTNSISAQYNNYIANSKLNFSLGVNSTFTDNQIAQNNILIQTNLTHINETHYVNLNGAHSVVGRYNVAKQLADRKYNLSLNGNITYRYDVGMSNNILYHSTNWRFDERFGPRITPAEWIEINPYVGYDLSRSFNSLPATGNTVTANIVKTTSMAIDGRMYFFKTWQVNYSATKSYVQGLQGLSTNPLVINAGFEKEFFKKKALVITFNAYDLLHQNNFVQQTVTTTGITNTQSNSLSRYFLFGARIYLQKWSGTPSRNGRQMMRRGDGSFIY